MWSELPWIPVTCSHCVRILDRQRTLDLTVKMTMLGLRALSPRWIQSEWDQLHVYYPRMFRE